MIRFSTFWYFKGLNGSMQQINNKPVQVGYKIWVFAEAYGYLVWVAAISKLVHGPGAQNWGDGVHSRSLSLVTFS